MQPLLARIDEGLGRGEPGAAAAARAGGEGRGGDAPPFEFVVVEAVLYVLEQATDAHTC